jgi:nucleoid-associated protein YgaU
MSESQTVRFFGPAQKAADENTDPFDPLMSDSSAKTEVFWDFASADELKNRWNKSFPYQFLILRRENGTYTVNGVIDQFTLPIPPQQLNITTPFAITTSVTLGGILEEHNGAPIRMISIQGTTGILPLRGTVAKPSVLDTIAPIFAGTVNGVQQITTAVGQASNLGVGPGSVNPAVIPDADFSGTAGDGTGYYQFHLLKRFFEYYLALKAQPNGKDIRLAFAVWKDKEIYLVTPMAFDLNRNISTPLEYMFSIQLKAWKRVVLETSKIQPFTDNVGLRDPNKVAQVLNGIETARRVLDGVKTTLMGVRSDINNVLLTPLRQTSFFLKDLNGTALTAIDLPSDIIADLREPILELANLKAGFEALGRTGQVAGSFSFVAASNAVAEAFQQLSVSSGKADHGSGTVDLGPHPPKGRGAHPVYKIVQNAGNYFDFFSKIKLNDLNLRPNHILKIEKERRKNRALRREDFEAFRDDTLRMLADFSDAVGAGDSTYTETYGTPVRTTTRTPTDSDWDIIFSLSSLAQYYDTLAASSTINRDTLSSIEFIAGLASRSGIAFRVPKSKFSVAFPYGSTLEQLANRYLKDPNRWHEIAALNGLKAPYVDEVGFKIPLIVNGRDNQVTVESSENLFVGQLVWLSSTNVRRERRRIQGIEILNDFQTILTLDGDDDLSKFTTAATAQLQAFLPDTINSQQTIFIPSDTEPEEEDFRVKSIPGVDYFDPLVRSGGIDLLLTNDGDIVITPDGGSRLAVGLTNLIQKVRLVLGTPQGGLLHHPEYGLGLIAGTSTADLSAKDLLVNAKKFFTKDQGFSGVQSASIIKDGNHLSVRLSVGIAATGQFVPIETAIKQ